MTRALLTGALGGLGRAFAARLRADGYDVVEADVEQADLADPDAVIALATSAGDVDVLVNNAADLARAPLSEITLGAWERTLAVNVTAPMLLARALAPGMAARGGGRIVNVVSNTIWGPPGPGMAGYVTSKAALLGLTRALAVELGPQGITVNALAPGLTRTETAVRDLGEAFFDAVRAQQALPRSVEPEDVADALALLLGAGAMTGQAIRVDGGLITL